MKANWAFNNITEEETDGVVDAKVEEHPLDTPAGTPFIASVCSGIPQLVVRTHHNGTQQAWWYLNGTEWLQTDHQDLDHITPLTTEKA